MTAILLFAALLGNAAPAPVPFTTIAQSDQSGIEERRETVVRTAAEWKKLWQEHAPDQPMPKVDFTKSTVIGVFLGSRNSGGYRATIASVEREGADVVVTWREDKPAADAVVSQVLTAPFHLIRTERLAGKVTFR